MALTLGGIVDRLPGLRLEGDASVPVTAVADDSRAAGPGVLFIAVAGTIADGHRFLPGALAAGCAAVLVDPGRRDAVPADASVPVLVAENGTRAWPARLARLIAGAPDAAMTVVGVTGTNGKTTTAFLLRSLLGAALGPCGLLGTIVYDAGAGPRPAPLTTPGGVALYGLLGEMRDRGCRAAALEVSSHALDQQRVADLALDAAVLTNLSRDHLDYHRDLESYRDAKARILDLLRPVPGRGKGPGAVAVNADEPMFADLDYSGLRTLRFATGWRGRAGAVDLRVVDTVLDRGGSRLVFDFRGRELRLRSRLVGRFNVENLTAALAAGLALDLPADACLAALAGAEQVPGRMEGFALPGGGLVIVDYAHTPDALAAVLQSCRELVEGRLVVVFGCGGDRDRGKRPMMGAVAAREADGTWITSDNPRGEDPESICDAVADGFRGETDRRSDPCRVEVDRTLAIRAALAEAGPGDVVVVAGKGHEDYQIVGDRRLSLDDRGVIRDWVDGEAARG